MFLIDMEEKVAITLKIIDDGGDSFAQRAEMYYRKRPELINFVEESFRAYRALAERYDHLSRELQSANRTIATVYPERVHELGMDVDDEENASQTSTSSSTSSSSTDHFKRSIPKVPKIPKKDFRSPSMLISRKGSQLKRISTSAKSVPSSGLTREEALEEIDNVQKGILGLQTEKEYVKSMYEHGYQKFWEMENQITEMQKRVSGLQDEFGIQTVIEDDEARALMAATALKSCQESLVKLQEKQEKSTEEARVEQQKIKDAHERFAMIRAKFLGEEKDGRKVESKEENLDEETVDVGTEERDAKMLREKIKEKLELDSKSSLTVTELAEKIDELVNKVVSLETEVSSQTALVKRLGSETNQLQANIRSLENDNESLKEGSDNMRKKLKELEEELRRIKTLNRSFRVQNDNLQTHFTEASCNLDHLSVKLQSVKQDEEVGDSKPEKGIGEVKEEKEDCSSVLENSVENQTNPINDSSLVSVEVEERKQEALGEERKELSDEPREIAEVDKEEEDAKGQPNWRQLFLKGLEDREKILLEEYTSVLQDYKEVKKKLSEMENKNRDSIFELAIQIRELKSDVASKDEEIKNLKHKFDYPPQTNLDESPFTCSTEYKYPTSQVASVESLTKTPSRNLDQDLVSDELGVSNVETLEKLMASADNLKSSNENDEEKMVEKWQAVKPHSFSTIEEKFRSDIDGLLEENLEFWLRFSTSVHQIQKFETSIEDLQLDLSKLKENHHKKPEGIIGSKHHSIQSDARPIYRHLREIQTEMSLWLEHNAVLKDELQGRFTSLCNIQDEISRVSSASSESEKIKLSEYQAAKFQGEVLNMKQENNKVADELKVGLNRVKGLKVEVEKTLVKLNEELGISVAKVDHSPSKHPTQRPRIPLRSFLFGVKLKRQKQSLFSCVSPALQKQYSDLAAAGPPPT